MSRDEFEQLVTEALEAIPDFFKEKLSNVDITIEDWPTREQSQGRLLLGLYQGVPQTARTNYSLVVPDKITIFHFPIEIVSRGDPNIVKEVVIDTVQHEIAHHFGISDARLEEIKRESQK